MKISFLETTIKEFIENNELIQLISLVPSSLEEHRNCISSAKEWVRGNTPKHKYVDPYADSTSFKKRNLPYRPNSGNDHYVHFWLEYIQNIASPNLKNYPSLEEKYTRQTRSGEEHAAQVMLFYAAMAQPNDYLLKYFPYDKITYGSYYLKDISLPYSFLRENTEGFIRKKPYRKSLMKIATIKHNEELGDVSLISFSTMIEYFTDLNRFNNDVKYRKRVEQGIYEAANKILPREKFRYFFFDYYKRSRKMIPVRLLFCIASELPNIFDIPLYKVIGVLAKIVISNAAYIITGEEEGVFTLKTNYFLVNRNRLSASLLKEYLESSFKDLVKLFPPEKIITNPEILLNNMENLRVFMTLFKRVLDKKTPLFDILEWFDNTIDWLSRTRFNLANKEDELDIAFTHYDYLTLAYYTNGNLSDIKRINSQIPQLNSTSPPFRFFEKDFDYLIPQKYFINCIYRDNIIKRKNISYQGMEND